MRCKLSINSELDKLYSELDTVQQMSEEAVMLTFNADSKAEYIALINEEIDSLEILLRISHYFLLLKVFSIRRL